MIWIASQGTAQTAGPQDHKVAATGGSPSAAPVAGTKDTPAASQTIHRQVLEVNVPVSVLDKRGFPVIDLTENDFKVYEDGKLQTITQFRQDPLPPLRIGLVLDTSNSMRMQMKYEIDAAEEFVYNTLEAQNSRNKIFLMTFDESSSILQGFTSDPDLLESKIRGLKAGGGKALYDAIYNACENQMMNAGPREGTRRILVLISDGLDVQSKHTLAEAVSMAHRAETTIYTIGNSLYGFSNPGDKYLQELAEDTGGVSFFPLEKTVGTDLETGYLAHGTINEDGSQNMGLGAQTGIYTARELMHLSDSLESLGRELDSQYSISYTPSDQTLDGTYRRIRVVVRHKGVRVHAKTGYFAMTQPQAGPPAGQSHE
ncbi:MAG: VWA domain-containing protein [Acidobacteriota bacterium]|nr:VWA domain-containing protein [Acidobacteriota bacterium]